jgi:cytidyltransferase-like protein
MFTARLTEGMKIKIIAMGCGKYLSEMLMGDGSSTWLDSINLLYSTEEIDKWTVDISRDTKYVSEDRVRAILANSLFSSGEDENKNKIHVVVSGSLYKKGQREGRRNYICMIYMRGEKDLKYVEYDLYGKSRDEQEREVNQYVKYALRDLQSNKTLSIYSGSFNPFHAGHLSVINEAQRLLPNNEMLIDISNVHPTKGVVDEETMMEREAYVQDSVEGSTRKPVKIEQSSAAKFINKYHYYITKYKNEFDAITFVVGSDVWLEYETSLKVEFENNNDVNFLVMHRDYTKIDYNERWTSYSDKIKILHPLSWCDNRTDYERTISSTKIRENK